MKRLVRPRQGRIVGGVALGLANYFGIDVTVMRIIWVILLWILIPSEDKVQS